MDVEDEATMNKKELNIPNLEKEDINDKPECNSTCENSQIIHVSGAESTTQLPSCSQPLVLPDPVLCDGESGSSTTVLPTVQQPLFHNGGESSQDNRLEYSSPVSDISNAPDTFQTSATCDESKTLDDSSTLNSLPNLTCTVVKSDVSESSSQCNDIKSSAATSIEMMDLSTDYNHEAHKPHSDGISDQQMPLCGNLPLEPSSECHQVDTGHNDVINGCNGIKCEGMTDEISALDVNVKQEPFDSEYERPELIYRNGSIVVDSDDDTSSTMFSKNDAVCSDGDNDVSDEEVAERLNARKITMSKNRSRTEGEVFPEELPPIEYLTISPGEDVILEPLGTVSGVVGVLVIVKGNTNSPALYDDTVLFLQGRQPLGLTFEIFGTVEQPYYSVRFNNNKDIKDKDITVGDKVFFAPKADNLTKYVFISELRKIKCDDASWEFDNEPPPSHVEFSDDEEERRARQRLRNKDRGIDEVQRTNARKKNRRKKLVAKHGKDPQGPQLLRGDLNRNPFGNKDHMFSSCKSTHWPHSENLDNMGNGFPPVTGNGHGFPPVTGNGHGFPPSHRPHFSPHSPSQPPPESFGTFRKPWSPHPGFGERPGWNSQQILLGRNSNGSMPGSPNIGGFRNDNTFSSHQFRPFPRFSGMPFPPRHSAPGRSSGPPQSSMPSQRNSFGAGPYFTPPPSQVPNHQPHCFPAFNPIHPPPVVNAVFNLPPPPQRKPTFQ